MFDWKARTEFLKRNLRYNNGTHGTQIVPKENTNWRAAVYQLTDAERPDHNTLFIEVLCKQNEREEFRAVNWGWTGMTAEEKNRIGAIFPDKPPNEIKTHPIYGGQSIWLEVAGGDRVIDLHNGSYLVLFQEAGEMPPEPPEPTEPEPQVAVLMISKNWFDSLVPDEDGYVRIYAGNDYEVDSGASNAD